MPTVAAFSGGTPDAMAIPIHKGRATRNTTIDAKKSCRQVLRSVIQLMCRPISFALLKKKAGKLPDGSFPAVVRASFAHPARLEADSASRGCARQAATAGPAPPRLTM
jgi:hypothetical protein